MKEDTGQRLFTTILVIGDILFLNLGMLVAFQVGFKYHMPGEVLKSYGSIWPFVTLYGLSLLAILGLYTFSKRKYDSLLYRSIMVSIATALICQFLLNATMDLSFDTGFSLVLVVFQTLCIYLWRFSFEGLYFSRLKVKRIVLVGQGGDTDRIAFKLMKAQPMQYEIVGIYNADELQDAEDLSPIFRDIHGLYLNFSVPPEFRCKLVEEGIATGTAIFLVPNFYDMLIQGANRGKLDDLPFFKLDDLTLSPVHRWLKRSLDVVISLIGLLLSAPFFLLVAALVRLSSPGPVFYIQERLGEKGRIFKIIKFRTMLHAIEDGTGPKATVENDPRVTQVGKGLRATRLDELPQLLNVLRGDMSIVGPRPEHMVFIKDFMDANPEYMYRLNVKPGITGLAQVEGAYTTNIGDKLFYDLLYIRDYSILLDIKIILKTLQVPFCPEKAEGRVAADERLESHIKEIRRSSAEMAATLGVLGNPN
jgi:exopolysaccharide biosynthesis polyprenyl glycosylphosphotransferase